MWDLELSVEVDSLRPHIVVEITGLEDVAIFVGARNIEGSAQRWRRLLKWCLNDDVGVATDHLD